jgi:hypothetical protein
MSRMPCGWVGNRTYVGWRDATGACHVAIRDGATVSPLRHIPLHSLSFEWSYQGQGPTDLALSLLADALGEGPDAVRPDHGLAYELRHRATDSLTARLPRAGWWSVERQEILAWTREVVVVQRPLRPIHFHSGPDLSKLPVRSTHQTAGGPTNGGPPLTISPP